MAPNGALLWGSIISAATVSEIPADSSHQSPAGQSEVQGGRHTGARVGSSQQLLHLRPWSLHSCCQSLSGETGTYEKGSTRSQWIPEILPVCQFLSPPRSRQYTAPVLRQLHAHNHSTCPPLGHPSVPLSQLPQIQCVSETFYKIQIPRAHPEPDCSPRSKTARSLPFPSSPCQPEMDEGRSKK